MPDSASWLDSARWVIYTAITATAVLVAATDPRWDTTLTACALCFLYGNWRRRVSRAR